MESISKRQYEDKLNILISNVDEWLDEHVEYFNPLNIADKDTTFLYRKSFCEYSLYLYVCNKHSVDAKSEKVKGQFFTKLNDPKFIQLAKRQKKLFMAFGLPIAVANNIAEINEELKSYYIEQLYSKHSKSLELVPFRMMDYLFATEIFGDLTHVYPPRGLYEICNYSRLPDPIYADESQTYGLTHNVFYLTGMEKRQDFFGVNADFDNGSDKTLEALLLKFLSKKDLDISLELLASLALIGKCKQWHLDLVLSEIQQNLEDGRVIPGPTGRVRPELGEMHGEKFFKWAKNYHTMLVAAMCFRIVHDQLDDIVIDEAPVNFRLLHSLGHMQRLAADYNLPLLLALIKSLENNQDEANKMGLKHIIDNVVGFIDSQRRDNGFLGYYFDEKLKAKERGEEFERNILDSIKKIDSCIEWKLYGAA